MVSLWLLLILLTDDRAASVLDQHAALLDIQTRQNYCGEVTYVGKIQARFRLERRGGGHLSYTHFFSLASSSFSSQLECTAQSCTLKEDGVVSQIDREQAFFELLPYDPDFWVDWRRYFSDAQLVTSPQHEQGLCLLLTTNSGIEIRAVFDGESKLLKSYRYAMNRDHFLSLSLSDYRIRFTNGNWIPYIIVGNGLVESMFLCVDENSCAD